MSRKLNNYTQAAKYSNDVVYLSDKFDLSKDFLHPKTHKALQGGKAIRVIIDHDATGTNTPGTGDTVCRSVPRDFYTKR